MGDYEIMWIATRDNVENFDSDERQSRLPGPDQEVPAQEGIGPDRAIFNALQGDGDEQRDDDRVEDTADRIAEVANAGS